MLVRCIETDGTVDAFATQATPNGAHKYGGGKVGYIARYAVGSYFEFVSSTGFEGIEGSTSGSQSIKYRPSCLSCFAQVYFVRLGS
jgi:hypothetical protein